MAHLLIPALIALLPAAFAVWTGRRLLDLADDPAFAERLLVQRTRSGVVSGICIVLLMALAWDHFVWELTLLIATRMAVGYRIRRALYRETWSFGGYISFFSRLIVASFGFWVALGVMPTIAMMAHSRDWMLAGLLAVIVGSWGAAYGRVFCTILRARPVDDPAIRARFEQMVTQCTLRNVSLKQVDMCGGVFANAVALPSAAHPAVLVSSTLFERLDADETAAILAHELAHLEQHHGRGLRAAARVTYGLVAAGALVAPLIRLVPQSRDTALLLWPVVLIATMVVRTRHRQKHETQSDLRAVAITGNADAMIRALTKLHTVARMPRRWDVDFERRATHPSLARRIQAIQAAVGTAPAPLGGNTTFIDTDDERSVTFHEDRLELREGRAGSHSIDYGLLTAVRVDAKASGALRLVAVDASNRRWDIALRQNDLGRAQATLDIIDTRLGAAPSPAASLTLARLVALAALLLSGLAGQLAAMLVGSLPILKPGSPLIAAAGMASMAAAGLVWRDHFVSGIHSDQWMALAAGLFVCGALLIALSVASRSEKSSAAERRLTMGLAVCALLACSLVTLFGLDAIDLHRGALQWPSAAVWSLALAGAVAFAHRRRFRYAAVPAACVGLATMFLGSTTFLGRFVDDPFLAPSEPITVTTLLSPVATFTVPFEATQLWLSPTGRYVALSSEDEQERMTIHAGPAGGSLTAFEADEAMFVDEGRLLLLERQRTGAVLRVVDLERGSRAVWSRPVALRAGSVSIDRSSNRWQLLGWNDTGDIVSVTGRIGEDATSEEQWKSSGLAIHQLQPFAVSNGNLVGIETRSSSSRLTKVIGPWAPLIRPATRTESRLWTVGPESRFPFATSHFALDCRNTSLDEPATCTAFDGMTTRFFALDSTTRRLTALASMTGRFYVRGVAGCDWLAGWWDHAPVLVRPSTQEAIRVPEDGRRGPDELAMADKMIGAVFSEPHGSTVQLHSIERPD